MYLLQREAAAAEVVVGVNNSGRDLIVDHVNAREACAGRGTPWTHLLRGHQGLQESGSQHFLRSVARC